MFFRFFLFIFMLIQTGCGLSSGMVAPTIADAEKNSNNTAQAEFIQISPAFILSQIKKHAPKKNTPEIAPEHSSVDAYKIAPHDTLAITVWDHPELTIPSGANPPAELLGNAVRNDGTIFYPYVGVLHIAGKTVEQARILITKKLAHFIENPQVDVRIARYRSQFIYVTGEVNTPTTIALTDTVIDVVNAINQAGGAKSTADLSRINLIRKNGTQEIINLAKLQTEGRLSENKILKSGDHLFLPDSSNNIVFVTGEVRTPGSKQLGYQRYTLTRALADAGGIDNSTANPSNVYVLRGFTDFIEGSEPKVYVKIYQLDASSPAGLILGNQFALQAQDVIYVSTTEVARWGRVMGNLATTIQALTLARLFQ